ncbi:MAG: 3-alpha,7-alpha,12-alpha-trihydroxy-5-beta-cholest-24-enoyl-CoA hydratase, partial [Burkholderiales bacterium PBB5]
DETRPGGLRVLPSMVVVLGFPGSWMAEPDTGIDLPMIVHGDELIELHRPLPAAGTVRAEHRVVRIVDKGPGRGATITYDKDLFDADSGERLASVRHTTFARGDGGFSQAVGRSDLPLPPPAPVPARLPDRQLALRTLPQQALLYRLCADRNPLHSQPEVAREAGFERPILHGLCTYGFACRALLALWADHDPVRLKRLYARFSAPVLPGDTLRFDTWREGGEIAFRAHAVERGQVVLDFGRAHIDG